MTIIGVTGSIGVGKSTVTRILARLGYKIINADKLVHEFFLPKNDVYEALVHKWPDLKTISGALNTQKLGDIIFFDRESKMYVEHLVHPKIIEKIKSEIMAAKEKGEDLVIEVPLLFETGVDRYCDYIFTVVTDPKIQRKRVMARPNMTEKKFEAILKNQMPDTEEEKRADYVIRTLSTQSDLRYQIEAILADMERKTK